MRSDDGERAWRELLDLVGSRDGSLDDIAAMEDFIDRYADEFVERIEEQARLDRTFADLVADAHLGDMSGVGVDRVARLQDALFERGDLGISRVKGWFPLSPADFPSDDA